MACYLVTVFVHPIVSAIITALHRDIAVLCDTAGPLVTHTTSWQSYLKLAPICCVCRFIELWTQHVNSSSNSSQAGDLTPPCVVGPDAANGHKALQACQREYMQQLFADVTSFAGRQDGASGKGWISDRQMASDSCVDTYM